MKLQIYIAISALVLAASSQSSSAGLAASLPEFKTKSELQKAALPKVNTAPESPETDTFYTGKPYEASRESYLFQYRNYIPEVSRWSSVDPSGFPEGSNNNVYTAQPTSRLDPTGCTTVNVSGVPSSGTSGRLTITPVSPGAHQVGSDIQGLLEVNFNVTGLNGSSSSLVGGTMQSNGTLQNSGTTVGYYGWVVQHIQISYSVQDANNADADNTPFKTDPSNYPTNFWEAWLVGLDGTVYAVDASNGDVYQANPIDSFSTPQFDQGTHGYFNAMGTVTVFSQSAIGTTGPSTWGGLPVGGSNYVTTSEPSWWAGNSYYNHNIQMNWWE